MKRTTAGLYKLAISFLLVIVALSATSAVAQSPPTLAKSFSSASVPLNDSVTLTFTITNPNPAVDLTGVSFTDTLPAGLALYNPDSLVGSCDPGVISLSTTSISLAGATVLANDSCTFSVDVVGIIVGDQVNTTDPVTSNEGGTGGTATATVTVVALPPTITKAFGAAHIPLNGTTSLSFTLTNPNNPGQDIDGVAFTDTLPAGLVIATPSGLFGSCGGGTITAVAGGGSASLSGATLSGGVSCTFSVNVKGTAAGTKFNTTSTLTSNQVGPGTAATASINVALAPTLSKAFGAANMLVGDTTSLSFTIGNPNSGLGLGGVGFTDALPAGLVIATPNGLTGSCGGGTITAVAGSNSVSFSNANLETGPACTFSVNVTATTSGAKNNVTSPISSNEGGAGGAASASTSVSVPTAPTLAKSFGAASILVGDTTSLTFMVNNSNASTALTGVGFNDTMPAGLVIATPNGATGSCGGGTINAVAGSASVSLASASLAANTSCTFSVNVTANISGTKNNTTDPIASNESGVGGTASASIAVGVPVAPTLAKSFGATSILVGATTSLTFTAGNSNASTALTGVGFSDTMPAGLVIASPNGVTGTCGGGSISAVAGSTSVSLAGATLAANANCTFSVNVTATTSGTKNNTTGQITSNETGPGSTASASIGVAGPPTISAAFGATTVTPNSTTSLTFTITNTNPTLALTGIAFSDTLPAGLSVATPNALNNSCGGTTTATAGSSSISLSAGTLAAGGSCVVSINVLATAVGSLTTSTTVTTANAGTGNTTQATLLVALAAAPVAAPALQAWLLTLLAALLILTGLAGRRRRNREQQ